MNRQPLARASGKTVRLRFFAAIRETVGVAEESCQTGAQTVGELREELLARGGVYAQALAREQVLRLALNQVLCDEAALLPADAEVAFFPPVTGG
jgi:molybdopterin synthase sulfur carrier subunit